jgi:hypothetical protein
MDCEIPHDAPGPCDLIALGDGDGDSLRLTSYAIDADSLDWNILILAFAVSVPHKTCVHARTNSHNSTRRVLQAPRMYNLLQSQ